MQKNRHFKFLNNRHPTQGNHQSPDGAPLQKKKSINLRKLIGFRECNSGIEH